MTRTTLNLAAYLNRADPASSRIQPLDLVETPSPDLASPHLLFSDLTFLGALERPLAAEVQKLGCHTMEDVVAAARRIEKILEEQTDSKMERLICTMQDQIRLLKKDLKDAHEQIATHKATAIPTAALAATPASIVAAAQPPPPSPAQPPPLAPARHLYQGYPEENPYFQPPRRQSDR